LLFDTGPQPLSWNAGISAYTVANANVFANGIPMTGSYSLVTGGQTFASNFSYSLSLSDAGNENISSALTFTTVSLVGFPDSIQVSGLGITYPPCGAIFVSPGVVANVTASNGFNMELSPGAEAWRCNAGDYGELFTWSSPGILTATNPINGAATITSQPQSLLLNANSSTSFSVTGTGTLPISYQWLFNGSNIGGATATSLTISDVTQTNLGTYAVDVTNDLGSDSSSNATLSMYPFIAIPFPGAVTYWGEDATFSVGAWGTGPLSYQWFDNGEAITDATNETLELSSIQFTNAGLYWVVVSSAFGSVTNAPEQVVVNPAGVSLGLYPGVTITGVTNYNYIIQRTANLSDTNSWVTVGTLTLTHPVQLWVDTNVNVALPGNPQNYYRILPAQ
jgi:hypothetical protein